MQIIYFRHGSTQKPDCWQRLSGVVLMIELMLWNLSLLLFPF